MGLPFCRGSFHRIYSFLGRIFFLQHTNVDNIEKNFISNNYREAKLKAARVIFLQQTVLFWQLPL
jgi:hypothetical protein